MLVVYTIHCDTDKHVLQTEDSEQVVGCNVTSGDCVGFVCLWPTVTTFLCQYVWLGNVSSVVFLYLWLYFCQQAF